MILSEIIKRENNNIDLIRLFAAILVVWGHTGALAGCNHTLVPLMPSSITPDKLGLYVFFFFSGLLVTNSLLTKKKAVPFVLSRFFRIVPAFYALIVLTVFLLGPALTSLSFNEYFSSKVTWTYLVKNLTFNGYYELPGAFKNHVNIAINASLWSIPLELKCYLLVLVMYLLNKKLNVKASWILWILLFLTFVPRTSLLRLLGVNYSIVDTIPCFCFVIGSACAVYKESIRIDLTLVGALALLAFTTWRYANVSVYIYPIAFSIMLLYVTGIAPFKKFKPRRDISYGIYLWHWPLMQTIIEVVGVSNPYLLFGITVALTTAVAFVSCVTIETPAIAWGRRLSEKSMSYRWDKLDNSIWILCILLVAVLITKFFF